MNELKPCAHCGGHAGIRRGHDEDGCYHVRVVCNGCGLSTRGQFASSSADACPVFYGQVRDEWNRRHVPEAES